MARTTVYNNITSPEKIEKINSENKQLLDDFLDYLVSVRRAESTIKSYKADLLVFFCWCLDENDNKPFVQMTKREFSRFQSKGLNDWGWSPARVRTVKAAIASLGNYIENILDDDYPGYRSIVRKVESPPAQPVRQKTVWTEDELNSLLSALADAGKIEQACYFALAAFSGRRKAELSRFKVSDFGDDKLVFNGRFYMSDPIKTKGRGAGKMLTCYTLAKEFKPYLDAWLAYREQNGIDSKWLFPDHSDPSKELSISVVDGWARSASKLMNKDIYLHSFRHLFTTNLLRSGAPDSVVQTIVGWESTDMVGVYDDRTDEERIGGFFFGKESDEED